MAFWRKYACALLPRPLRVRRSSARIARSTSRPIAGPRLDRTSRARATSVSEAFFEDPAQSTAAASAPSPSPRSNEAAHAWKPPQRPIATKRGLVGGELAEGAPGLGARGAVGPRASR